MAINSYSTLKTAIQDWMDRSDVSGDVADFISLAEARFNRELGLIEVDNTLTGTVGSRVISVSAIDFIEPVGLWLTDTNDEREYEVFLDADGRFPYFTDNGRPTRYAIDGDNLNFECPLDEAYSFRFRTRSKFALSDAAPTNKLLEDHPDIYLAASIVWGGLFVEDDDRVARFAGPLDRFIREVKHTIAKNRKGTVFVDAALAPRIDTSWQW